LATIPINMGYMGAPSFLLSPFASPSPTPLLPLLSSSIQTFQQ
jgi:hypothetical protein